VPEAPPVTASHDALDTADHAHVASVVTLTAPLPPSELTVLDDADSVPAQEGAIGAACVTVYVRRATVSVPVRSVPVLASTLKDTEPLPAPGPPLAMASHAAFDVADHVQLEAVATSTVPAPPSAVMEVPDAERVALHGAACDTVTVLPAIVTVPVRAVASELGAMANDTLPLPVPLPPLATVIHAAFGVADQEQVASMVNATVSDSPSAEADGAVGDTDGVHVDPPGSTAVSFRVVVSLLRGPGAAFRYVVGLNTIWSTIAPSSRACMRSVCVPVAAK
jgi:hypothetical protein